MLVRVDLGGQTLVCEVARTAAEQARGLQGRPGLREGEGLLFPFFPPRAATFHMGTVSFPIDLVFADASGQVARIVHGAQPGVRTVWSHPVVGAVVEVPGGYCGQHGVGVGSVIRVAGQKLGAQTYNLLRTLTEASVEAAAPPLMDGYYGKEPLHQPPIGGRDQITYPDRFREHRLPDERSPNAMDQPDPGWEYTTGFDPGYPPYSDPLSVEMDDKNTQDGDAAPAAVRMSASTELVHPEEMVPVLIEASQRAGLSWLPIVTNAHREQTAVTAADIGRWIHELGLPEGQRGQVQQAAVSKLGLDALAQGFLASGMADTANVAPGPTLVLTRPKGQQPWT